MGTGKGFLPRAIDEDSRGKRLRQRWWQWHRQWPVQRKGRDGQTLGIQPGTDRHTGRGPKRGTGPAAKKRTQAMESSRAKTGTGTRQCIPKQSPEKTINVNPGEWGKVLIGWKPWPHCYDTKVLPGGFGNNQPANTKWKFALVEFCQCPAMHLSIKQL